MKTLFALVGVLAGITFVVKVIPFIAEVWKYNHQYGEVIRYYRQ